MKDCLNFTSLSPLMLCRGQYTLKYDKEAE